MFSLLQKTRGKRQSFWSLKRCFFFLVVYLTKHHGRVKMISHQIFLISKEQKKEADAYFSDKIWEINSNYGEEGRGKTLFTYLSNVCRMNHFYKDYDKRIVDTDRWLHLLFCLKLAEDSLIYQFAAIEVTDYSSVTINWWT